MSEVDELEQSFEAVEREDEVVETLKEEMAELRRRVDAQAIAGARPALSGARASSAFVDGYLRKGSEAGLEVKAMVGTSDAAGGYAVPEEIDGQIDRLLTSISPIRAIANVVKVGSAGYRKLVTTGGTPAGWVAEDAGRPETATPSFIEIAPPSGELYANPAASQAMLDDAAFDVEAWLAQEIATEFARAEGAAFVGGSGVDRPMGFLAAPNSAALDGVRPRCERRRLGAAAASRVEPGHGAIQRRAGGGPQRRPRSVAPRRRADGGAFPRASQRRRSGRAAGGGDRIVAAMAANALWLRSGQVDRLMFERLSEHARRSGERRARETAARIADAMAAELPPGIATEARDDGVELAGSGLRRRFALEPALRWLVLRQAEQGRGGNE